MGRQKCAGCGKFEGEPNAWSNDDNEYAEPIFICHKCKKVVCTTGQLP